MTYCLGLYLKDGLVLASDSRTNAGVDHIALVRKMTFFGTPGERMLALLSAGNLATTQAVVTVLQQRDVSGDGPSLGKAATMYDAAQIVGDTLREVLARDGDNVRPFGDPGASFLLGGQIADQSHQLYEIYQAGNFIAASAETPYLQIGETKYGKPILDRVIRHDNDLPSGCKCALLSMDATFRSNLAVAPPIDLLSYTAGSLVPEEHRRLEEDEPYLVELRRQYSRKLMRVVNGLPTPPWLNGKPGTKA